MPKLTQKSSSPPRPTRRPPPMLPDPPSSDPSFSSRWEEMEGLRFTFLMHFRWDDAEAMQRVAQLLYSLILETPVLGEEPLPGPETRWELVAGLAELKFLEGYFTSVFNEHRDSSLPPDVEELSRYAGGIASGLSDLAFRLNEELAKWRT
jgi:hypothetical protein